MAKCPQPVLDLIEHLKSTGTGKEKLAALEKLGGQVKNPEQFIEQASKVIPAGTMNKIREYLAAQGKPVPPEPTPEPPKTTETEDARAPEAKSKTTNTNQV